MLKNIILFLFYSVALLLSGCGGEKCDKSLADLKLLGTRNWIRLTWQGCPDQEYKIYWSETDRKPETPEAVVKSDKQRYYIENVVENKQYYVWIEEAGKTDKILADSVATNKEWKLDTDEVNNLSVATSAALPAGMELYWHDEFNDAMLNRNKWSTNYYSTWDFMDRTNWEDYKNNNLPQPAMIFTDTTIRLVTNDQMPERDYWKSGRKISSIQTFDWNTGENYLDNSRGGYFEVKVRRSGKDSEMVNTAFWFDSPGSDLKYYLEAGNELNGVKGIRPHGQVFEIDVFEYLNAELVLHGNVSPEGEFKGNIGHYIINDEQFQNQWVTHGMLWTPSGLRFYVNGKLKKEWTDPQDIKAPDHFMNVFLGTYGKGGHMEMEVDYIRYYRWPLENGNELPDADFEYSDNIFPWEGTGKIVKTPVRSGKQSVLLNPGEYVEQYVYVNHDEKYNLSYWQAGNGKLKVTASNLVPVTGKVINSFEKITDGTPDFVQNNIEFIAGPGLKEHMQTVKIVLTNTGEQSLILDDLKLNRQE